MGSKLNRYFQHLLFWALSYYILLRIFATGSTAHRIDYYYTVLFHIPLIIGVYINTELLIPRLLAREKQVIYFIVVACFISSMSLLDVWFFDQGADKIFMGYYFISYYEWIDIVQFFMIYLTITSLLKLSRGWFQLSKTEKQLAKANQQKLEAELKALKSQINPHFLFNSLNSLYGLALKKDDQTPHAILKLSECLRYIIYDCNTDFVDLQSEIDFISNYVDLQRLRSKTKNDIELNIEESSSGLKIAPMLLIAFVENGFKHGVKGDSLEGFIKIHIAIKEKHLLFKVENNKGTVDEKGIKKSGGVGLENVKQRLDLLYPKNYDLDTQNLTDIYSIILKMDLS